ncbi:phosphotransferase family protein [Salirhabdus salicampi]|uniref:phosphotransferase family protein n=1 Tax=Salirhabdus salicampi TaxID=476102 RepID=UPI0020C3E463|nr:aminoglycoside phosphotransferase family protein [Salirhabdus salicampi]MCP8615861.1 aminoglycoside phosphotransferase family protein [Salirhabdus salicampi]
MRIEDVLHELQLHQRIISYDRILDGLDSFVWKVKTVDNGTYALRVLPVDKHHQFVVERQTMDILKKHHIPVPDIHFLEKTQSFSIMLMDWVKGRTVIDELKQCPENAEQIGFQFGKVQAKIHRIRGNIDGNWLLPKTKDEENIQQHIASLHDKTPPSLLHLDYHPLNVLTDGENISGVIDWVNASIGDYRYDVARTLSLLRLEHDHLVHSASISTLETFEKGWSNGYGISDVEDLSLFCLWAGFRLKWYYENKNSPEKIKIIESWIKDWRKKAGGGNETIDRMY